MIHSYKAKDRYVAEARLNGCVVVCSGQTEEDAHMNLNAKLTVLNEDSRSAIDKLRQDKMATHKMVGGNIKIHISVIDGTWYAMPSNNNRATRRALADAIDYCRKMNLKRNNGRRTK